MLVVEVKRFNFRLLCSHIVNMTSLSAYLRHPTKNIPSENVCQFLKYIFIYVESNL